MGLKSFIFGLKHQFFYGVFPPPLQHFWLNYTNVAKTKQSKFVYWLFYTKTVNFFFLFLVPKIGCSTPYIQKILMNEAYRKNAF